MIQRLQKLAGYYLKPHWPFLVILAALFVAVTGLQAFTPVLLSHYIDSVTSASSSSTNLGLLALYVIGAGLATQFLGVAETYIAEYLGWTTTNALRRDLVRHSLNLDTSYFIHHPPGEMIERLDGDVAELSAFFSRFVLNLLGNAALVVGILIILIVMVDWRIGVALLLLNIGRVWVLGLAQRLSVPEWQKVRAANAALFAFLEERFAGTENIRANGSTGYTVSRLFPLTRAVFQQSRRAGLVGSTSFATSVLFSFLTRSTAAVLGAYLFHSNIITIGKTYLIFYYVTMLIGPVNELSNQIKNLQQSSAAVARIDELLEQKSSLIDSGTTRLEPGALSVEFDHVSFGYDRENPVLSDVTLHLRPGHVLGILGRTGSGKTTIARLLFRLFDPNVGTIRIGGVPLTNIPLHHLREHVGMVTQEVKLFRATLRENLTFFDESIPEERIHEVLASLRLSNWVAALPDGLDTMMEPEGATLSAGEAQLLSLARAFLKDPSLVILDEPSSLLDPATEQHIQQAIRNLLRNRTGIVIAHRLATIQDTDDILILEGGTVREYGERIELQRQSSSYFHHLLQLGLQEVMT